MKVFLQNSEFNDYFFNNINQFVVYDDEDRLLAVMWHRDDGTIALSKAGDKDFELICSELGLNKNEKLRKITIRV